MLKVNFLLVVYMFDVQHFYQKTETVQKDNHTPNDDFNNNNDNN